MKYNQISMQDSVVSPLNDVELLETALLNIIENIPAHIYWKNVDGNYLGCNETQAKSLGFMSSAEVIGKTDFELPWPEGFAQEFWENDLEVMKTGDVKVTEEHSIMAGKNIIVLSQKVPLKNKRSDIVGLLGISLDITDCKEKERLKVENLKIENERQKAEIQAQKTFKKCLDDVQHTIQNYKINVLHEKLGLDSPANRHKEHILLTKREREILYYLSLNKSPKEIADILSIIDKKNVAPKTIQSIIDKQLYIKFDVYNVSQLIEQANLRKFIPFLLDN